MIEKNFELALDDEKLRRRNTQKLINTIEKAADLMIEGKKTQQHLQGIFISSL